MLDAITGTGWWAAFSNQTVIKAVIRRKFAEAHILESNGLMKMEKKDIHWTTFRFLSACKAEKQQTYFCSILTAFNTQNSNLNYEKGNT